MEHLSKDFWKSRYQNDTTGWDLGEISPPIKAYFDQVEDKNLRILIPGCGNGHEAEYLFKQGFSNVHVIDLAEEALNNLKSRVSNFPEHQLYVGDFFEHQGDYDIVVEQTMFCAIDRNLRQQYADQVHNLLSNGGKLIGVMFGREFESGPPYGGSMKEYLAYFEKYDSVNMELCYNSVEPRDGAELFVRIVK